MSKGTMNFAQLVVVRNPFDRSIRDERVLPLDDALTIARIVDECLPVSAELAVSIDGELITHDEWAARTLKPGEQLVVMPLVHGGDNPLGTILMIGLAVFAPFAAAAINTSLGLGLAAGGLGMGLLTVGVSMLGSMVLGGLMAPSKQLPSSAGLQSFNNSPVYSWSPATTQQPGGPVARAYGRHKLYGNIIAGYIESQGSTGQEQIAHLLIDLGSGPYSQLYDFKINDQPVANYSGVTITARMGNINQDPVPAFNDTRLTHSINAKVVMGVPVVRETVGSDYDALEILLTCPQGLWYANNAGGLDNISVTVAVEISADGGATWNYVAVEPRTIVTVVPGYWSRGYTTSYKSGKKTLYKWVEAAKGSSVKADHVEGALWTTVTYPRQSWHWMAIPTSVATVVYDSITLGQAAAVSSPPSAPQGGGGFLGVVAGAIGQVAGISSSTATQQPIHCQLRVDNLVRGTKYKIRCTNLSPDQTSSRYGDDLYLAEINEVMYDDFQYPRTVLVGVDALATNQLSGSLKFSCMAEAAIVRVWDGSAWSSVWSNNPAWVCWDILTQPVLDNSLAVVRYDGLDPSRLNLASFYDWAQFCDTQVQDGKGGWEARCSFDGVFDTPTSLWDAALEVCASARAQLVIRGTTVMAVVDKVRTAPAQLFNVGNTAVSSFNETFLPMQDRAASIEVNYLDAAQDYARDTLTVVNTAITEAAAQRTSVGLRGVTRASQAWREANFRLKRNELLKRSASIGVDIDALACTVGDLIWLQGDVTRWGVGGRAASGSTTMNLVLDQPVTLDAGKTYELKLRLADDTLVTRAITTPAGTVTAVDVSAAFPSAPALYDVWAIGETNKAVKEFIVLDITRDGEQRAKLALIEYNSTLYGLDNGIPALPTPNISYSALPAISNLRLSEGMMRAADGAIVVYIDVDFDRNESVAKAQVIATGGLGREESTSGTARLIGAVSGETYTVEVRPVGALGELAPPSAWWSASITVVGKLAPPADVSWFSLHDKTLSWGGVSDVDLAGYRLRWIPGTVADWVHGQPLHDGLITASPWTIPNVPSGTSVLMIKAVDTSDNESLNVAKIAVNIGDPLVANVIDTIDLRAAGFPGVFDGQLSAGDLVALTTNSIWSPEIDTPFWSADDTSPMWDLIYYQALIYRTTVTLGAGDAGAQMTIARTLSGTGARLDYRRPVGDSALMFGDEGTPMWSNDDDAPLRLNAPGWQPWPGAITAEAGDYEIRVRTVFSRTQGRISALAVNIDVPDITEYLHNVNILGAGTRLPITKTYHSIRAAHLTLQDNASSAVTARVMDKNASLGPLVKCFDVANAATAGQVDAIIQGF